MYYRGKVNMDSLLKTIDGKKNLKPGTIIRRIGKNKDQQGSFLKYDDDMNLILVNIIDMASGTLVAIEGVLNPQSGDKIYYYDSSFAASSESEKAIKIVKEWPLYKKHADLREQILNFVKLAFIPEQIIEMSKNEKLPLLFVPIQQRFRIGRFTEHRLPERVCNENFMLWLESLSGKNQITYLARIIDNKDEMSVFFSVGNKPHDETDILLQKETYKFDPTHGGHIKTTGIEKGKKHFIVDAGSKYMGLGVKTSMQVCKAVVNALKKQYPEFEFTALEGCGVLEK